MRYDQSMALMVFPRIDRDHSGQVAGFEVHLEWAAAAEEPFVTLEIEVINGAPRCCAFGVRSAPHGREVRANDYKGIRLEEVLEWATAAASMSPPRPKEGDSYPIDEAEERTRVYAVRAARKQTRRRITDEVLQEVAVVYRANVEDGPTAAVADAFGKSHRTAALYVQTARGRTDPATGKPFLGKATKGKAGEQ